MNDANRSALRLAFFVILGAMWALAAMAAFSLER
jgi:hypothetical protein